MNMITHRVSPQQARYTPMGGREKCSFCRFYIAPKWCGHVTGPVSPMGWCKYFSQEMRAQFGGSQVVAIGPPGATLDLGFMTPGTLDSRITFTRASTATYTDASGTIQPAAINAPRWDYAGGVLRGLLIEEARTNALWPSLATGVGNWSTFGSAALSAAGIVAPDGTTGTAALVAATSTAADIRAISNAVASGTAGTAYTLSVFIKKTATANCFFQVAAGGVATAYFDLTNGTGVVGADLGAGITNKSVAVTPYPNGWYRVSYTLTPNATGAISWYIGMCAVVSATGDNRSAVGVVGQGIYAWGAQIETGSFATSYIPTISAAVTRAQDLNTMSTSPWMTANLGSWFADFTLFGVSPGTCVISANVGGTSSPLIVLSASNLLASWDGGAVLQTANAATPGAVNKGVSAFASPTGKICLNGGAVASGAQTGITLPIIGFISAIPGPAANNGSGYIRRVQYWPRALSNAEMQQVTT